MRKPIMFLLLCSMFTSMSVYIFFPCPTIDLTTRDITGPETTCPVELQFAGADEAVIRGEPISLCFGFRMGGGHEFLTKNSAQIIWTKTFGPLLWLSITERSCIHPNMLGGVAHSICAIDREDFMQYSIWAMSFQAKWSSEVALSVIFKDKVVEHFHF